MVKKTQKKSTDDLNCSEKQLFFCQKWDELFDHTTFDSWQVRTTNINTLIREMQITLAMSLKSQSAYKGMFALWEELEVSIKECPIVACEHLLQHFFKRLKELITQNNNLDIRNHAEIQFVLEIIQSKMSNYLFDLVDNIEKIIFGNENRKYKITLEKQISSFATQLINEGFSRRFLQANISMLTEDTGKAFEERWKFFKDSLSNKKNQYSCYLKLLNKKDDFPASFDNVCFMQGSVVSNEAWFIDSKFRDNDLLAKISINAADVFSAREKATQSIEHTLSVFNVCHLHQLAGYDSKDNVIVVDNITNNPYSVSIDDTYRKYIRPARNWGKFVARYQSVYGKLSQDDKERLDSCLQYHRVALSVTTDESMLINLWIAIESLVRDEHETSSTIDSVCNAIVPSISLVYLKDTLRHFATELKQLLQRNEIADLKLAGKFDWELNLSELLSFLMDKDDSPRMATFLSKMSKNPYFLFKTSLLQKKFTSVKESQKQFLLHRQHLDWQIRRIYRCRNMIMHCGIKSEEIPQLVQHAHSYLITILNNLLSDIGTKNLTIAASFRYRKQLFDFMVDRNNQDNIKANDFLNIVLDVNR